MWTVQDSEPNGKVCKACKVCKLCKVCKRMKHVKHVSLVSLKGNFFFPPAFPCNAVLQPSALANRPVHTLQHVSAFAAGHNDTTRKYYCIQSVFIVI